MAWAMRRYRRGDRDAGSIDHDPRDLHGGTDASIA